jgi:WD40 repeat protein
MLVLGFLFALVPNVQDVPPRFLERTLAAYEALDRGELPRAKQLFEANLERFPSHANSAYALACIEARSGNVAPALDRLARAVESGWADADVALWDEDLKTLRGEERFDTLLATMHAFPRDADPVARLEWTAPTVWPEFSTNGSRVACRGASSALFDACTGELIAAIPCERGVKELSFAPGGSLLAVTSNDGTTRYWNSLDGRREPDVGKMEFRQAQAQGERRASDGRARSVHTCSDATLLTASVTERCRRFAAGDFDGWRASDGSHVLSFGLDAEFRTVGVLYEGFTGSELVRFDVVGGPPFRGGFTASGRFAWWTSGGLRGLYVVDASPGGACHELRNSYPELQRVVADGERDELVTIDDDRLDRWDLERRQVVRSVPLPSIGSLGTARVSPDGRYFASIRNGEVLRVLDVLAMKELWSLPATRFGRWDYGAAFTPDGERLAVPAGGRLTLFETRTGRELGTLGAPRLGLRAVSLHPDGTRMVVACESGDLRVVELATARTLATWRVHAAPIDTCRFLGDAARLLVGWSDGVIAILDGESGATLHRIDRAGDASWNDLSATSDGRRVLTSVGDRKHELLDAETGEVLARLASTSWLSPVAFDEQGGHLAAERGAGVIGLWSLETGAPVRREFTTGDIVHALSFSPDGKLLACGTEDNGLFLWRVEDGALVLHHDVPDLFAREDPDALDKSFAVQRVEFEPDGRSILFTTGDLLAARRLRIATGEETTLYDTMGGPGAMVAHPSASGTRLFVYGSGEHESVLDAETGTPLLRLHEVLSWVDGTSDDRWVVGTVDRRVRVFGRTLNEGYTYVPFEGGDWIAETESLHCAGTAEALRWAVVVGGDETYPFASFAAQLLDPKRVRAAAAGVSVRPAQLGTPPSVRAVGEAIRSIGALDDSVEFEVDVASPAGFGDCEAELDGKPVDEMRELFASLEVSGEPSRVAIATHRERTREPNELRLVFYDRTGIGSRPLRMRFVPEP